MEREKLPIFSPNVIFPFTYVTQTQTRLIQTVEKIKYKFHEKMMLNLPLNSTLDVCNLNTFEKQKKREKGKVS